MAKQARRARHKGVVVSRITCEYAAMGMRIMGYQRRSNEEPRNISYEKHTKNPRSINVERPSLESHKRTSKRRIQ